MSVKAECWCWCGLFAKHLNYVVVVGGINAGDGWFGSAGSEHLRGGIRSGNIPNSLCDLHHVVIT